MGFPNHESHRPLSCLWFAGLKQWLKKSLETKLRLSVGEFDGGIFDFFTSDEQPIPPKLYHWGFIIKPNPSIYEISVNFHDLQSIPDSTRLSQQVQEKDDIQTSTSVTVFRNPRGNAPPTG